jgi:hypothetical protein
MNIVRKLPAGAWYEIRGPKNFYFSDAQRCAREDARTHASAIKGLFGEELGFALLCEYFRREGCVALRQK